MKLAECHRSEPNATIHVGLLHSGWSLWLVSPALKALLFPIRAQADRPFLPQTPSHSPLHPSLEDPLGLHGE